MKNILGIDVGMKCVDDVFKPLERGYSFNVPFPPSVNALYGGGSGQQRFKTKRYKEWCKSVGYIVDLGIDYPVHITYTFTWPDARSRDGQNYLKAPTDLMVNAGMIKDDNWSIIQSESWDHNGIDKNNSGVLVKIYKIS